jgi:hypothetical protein
MRASHISRRLHGEGRTALTGCSILPTLAWLNAGAVRRRTRPHSTGSLMPNNPGGRTVQEGWGRVYVFGRLIIVSFIACMRRPGHRHDRCNRYVSRRALTAACLGVCQQV